MTAANSTILTAHRGDTDEPWRMERLEKVLVRTALYARASAAAENWQGALLRMHDRKGNLTVVWRSKHDCGLFRDCLVKAWNAVQEYTPIQHYTAGEFYCPLLGRRVKVA